MPDAPLIPLAARFAAPPVLVETSALGVTWDDEQQLNIEPGGSPWHATPQAASCTDTNQDGKGDDVNDPYLADAS